MPGYVLRRLLYVIPTLFLISVLSFAVIQAPPGDYLTSQIEQLRQQYGDGAGREIEALRQRYGLGQPLYRQYLLWMKSILLHGDFGQSFLENRPVSAILLDRLPFTIVVTLLALLFTWAVAIPIGVYSAVRQYSVLDYVFTFLAFIGRSVPSFLLALILMVLFYEGFGWSLGGLFSLAYQEAPWSWGKLGDLCKHLVLPVIVVGTAGAAETVRVLRSMVLDELGKAYVETARAKGLPERAIVWKHVFKIAVLPLVSTIGRLLPQLVSGAIIASIVLNLPTAGATMYTALLNQDMYVAGSFVLLLSTLTILGTLISDLCLAWIDPRIRYG